MFAPRQRSPSLGVRHFAHDNVEVHGNCDETTEEDKLDEESADHKMRAICETRLCARSLDAASWNSVVSQLLTVSCGLCGPLTTPLEEERHDVSADEEFCEPLSLD